MKYCQHCGNQLVDEAVVCPNCGCAAGELPIKEKTSEADDTPVLKTIAKIFMILGCIAGAFAFLIPLAWKIPMTVHYWKSVENKQPVGTGFKICSLLFVNMIAGILMLCDDLEKFIK